MEPPRITPIASDWRGASWSLYFPDIDAEMVIIFSKKGALRGGHYHDKPETSLLLTGKAHYWKKLLPGKWIHPKGKEIEFDELPGETLHNEAGEIHRARFDEDSWLIDWKINTKKGEAKTINDPEYRAMVDKQMADAADFQSA